MVAVAGLVAGSSMLACSSGQLRDQTPGPGVSPGTVTFRLQLPATQSYCDLQAGCAGPPQHLSITTTAGNELPLSVGFCAIDCSKSCEVHPCDLLCPIGTAVAVTKVEQTWDGSYFAQSTCGKNTTACTETRYVLPGRYLARLCATPGAVATADAGNQICTAVGQPECVETMFDIPGPSPIEMALP
jgi:hypothetical protein